MKAKKEIHDSMARLFKVAETTKRKDIAKALKLELPTVSNWVTRGVSKEGAIKASEVYGVDVNYILHGRFAMAQNQINNHGYIGGSVNQSVVHQASQHKTNEVYQIPFYANADFSQVPSQLALTYQLLDNKDSLVAILASDNFMSPIIGEKSLVVADKSLADGLIYNGKIYLLSINNLLICRYLQPMAGEQIRIFSEKDGMGDILTRQTFESSYQIVGGVVWWASGANW